MIENVQSEFLEFKKSVKKIQSHSSTLMDDEVLIHILYSLFCGCSSPRSEVLLCVKRVDYILCVFFSFTLKWQIFSNIVSHLTLLPHFTSDLVIYCDLCKTQGFLRFAREFAHFAECYNWVWIFEEMLHAKLS